MNHHFFLGIDNSQPNIARTVCLTLDGTDTSCLTYFRSKSLLAFQGILEKTVGEMRPDAVATGNFPHDPFGTLDWLRQQETQIAYYDKHQTMGMVDQDDLEFDELPKVYSRAYELALRLAYEVGWPRIIEAVGLEATYLRHKLSELQSQFEYLDLKLKRIYTMCPRDPPFSMCQLELPF